MPWPTVCPAPPVPGGLTQMIRQAVAAHRVVYGAMRVGGPLVFVHTRAPAGTAKLDLLHLVVVLAAHEVEATAAPFARDGVVYAQVWTHRGAPDQAADPVLIASTGGRWTNAHRLRGRAWLHAQLRYDERAFPLGIPNLSAVVRGRRLFDPRTGATAWSDNAALCVLDTLRAPFGLNAPLNEIDLASFIAAANICDEPVARPGGQERRYTCNGVMDISQAPLQSLPALLTSCAGRLTYTAGRWRLFVGAWVPPMTGLSEDEARDTLTIKPRRSRRELVNLVRGTFVSPAHGWQSTDYPPVSVAAYRSEDGDEEVAENLNQPFTRSPYQAQRVARIALETRRRQMTVHYPANLTATRLSAGETILLSLPRLGITELPMTVTGWRLTEDLGVDLSLHQDGPEVYAMALGELRTMPAVAALSLTGNQDVPPAQPTGLVATVTGSTVRLTWSQESEPDFAHFEVWEHSADTAAPAADATLAGEPYANTWTRDRLAAGASRFWWVRAFDRHGNRGAFAGPAQATLPPAGGALLLE